MVMEGAALTDRNLYQERLARTGRKGPPAAEEAVEDEALADQQLCQHIQQQLLQQTRHKLQQTQQELQQTQQELRQTQQQLQAAIMTATVSQQQVLQLQEQVSDMLIVDHRKKCLHLCATIIACNYKQ